MYTSNSVYISHIYMTIYQINGELTAKCVTPFRMEIAKFTIQVRVCAFVYFFMPEIIKKTSIITLCKCLLQAEEGVAQILCKTTYKRVFYCRTHPTVFTCSPFFSNFVSLYFVCSLSATYIIVQNHIFTASLAD